MLIFVVFLCNCLHSSPWPLLNFQFVDEKYQDLDKYNDMRQLLTYKSSWTLGTLFDNNQVCMVPLNGDVKLRSLSAKIS